MRTAASVFLVALAGNAVAQTPPTRQDATVKAPMATQPGTAASQHHPAASRDQLFNAPMGIQIEGQGLALPTGVAEDPLIPPAAPQPAAAPKPPEQPPTQK